MVDERGRFVIEDYGKQTTFSGFLPGISGVYGIPIWCFYVNRGQAVTSFGAEDKNHSIMEFYPAHQAYQITKRMGFRSFLMVDDVFGECFSDAGKTKMYLGMNELEIEELHEKLGIQMNVLYYTLPEEKLGALVRTVTIKNISDKKRELQVLDGMPAVIPYGINLQDLKEMAQTMKAWMQAEDVEKKLPYYRVRFSTKDSASVSKVEGGNFMVSFSRSGERMPVLVDPELIFEYDTSLERPVGFLKKGIHGLKKSRQITQNQVPCGFTCAGETLEPGQELTFYTVIGQARRKNLAQELAEKIEHRSPDVYFREKHARAVELTEILTEKIHTKTADPVFDGYCSQTYLDNILRGGEPVQLGKDGIFYVYSRKHGDIERDYNFFSMLPEYFSQGNGNFRDVNQNRRSDVLFSPYVGDYNIKMFYNLIQLDGYNPLAVKQTAFEMEKIEETLKPVKEKDREAVRRFFENEFSPGGLCRFLDDNKIALTCSERAFTELAVQCSRERFHADFGEGYWTDHWTYNLDLVEAYLSIYPEDEKRLLFEDCSYTYFESEAAVRPRLERYVRTPRGVRQYHAVEEVSKDEVLKKEAGRDTVRKAYGKGEEYTSSLMTKLLVLGVNKFASLDMYGMGVEMEGGKPGWYDALNGLPGIFGSSVNETCELKRMLVFAVDELEKYDVQVKMPEELYEFMMAVSMSIRQYTAEKKERLWVWNRMNCEKEKYRSITFRGVSGNEKTVESAFLAEILKEWIDYAGEGIRMACERKNGIAPAYLTYSFTDFKAEGSDIVPENLKAEDMPLFLEGPVRYLKVLTDKREKQELYKKVKGSQMYDRKLHMYKVNESLEGVSFEAGRAKAFSPGWLENESVWLHMEYKYLLELLKGGLYQEFFEDFRSCAVPFLPYEMYGRSPMENSSFIVSSANEDEKIHGKGFVARLSGSTAEFLQIWQLMMFGTRPFFEEKETLVCRFAPAIPSYLIPEDGIVESVFLGKTEAVYHLENLKELRPGEYRIRVMKLVRKDGVMHIVQKDHLRGEEARLLRSGDVESIHLYIESK